MKILAANLLAAILAAGAVVAAYHHWMVRPALMLALVDVAGVYGSHEAALKIRMIKARDEAELKAVESDARAFAERLPAALDELAAECGCMLLDKSVVIGKRDGLPDLTDQLTEKVSDDATPDQ